MNDQREAAFGSLEVVADAASDEGTSIDFQPHLNPVF